MDERMVTLDRPATCWQLKLAVALTLAGTLVSLVFLLGSQAAPAVAIVYAAKTYSLFTDADSNGAPSPGDTLLYTVAITNSGDTPAFGTSLGDGLIDTSLSLLAGSVQTSQGSVSTGNGPGDTTVYVVIGDIAASATVTITFQVQIVDPLPPGVVDAQNQGIVRYTDGGAQVLATDDPTAPGPTDPTVVPILRDPALIVQKTLVGADTDIVQPNYLTFTIAITNVGVTVDVLSMTDEYDPYYLSFYDASPYPEEDADDGTLTWYDLTAPPPYGVDGNLVPGGTISVTVIFTAAHDITVTVNTARVHTATDVFGAPAIGSSSDAVVVDVPTAAEVAYFRVEDVDGRSVQLTWATITEIDNVGFRLYRAHKTVRARAEMVAFVPSQGHGTGATYGHVDTVPDDGVWWYWLTDVDTSGIETFQGAVHAVAEKGPDTLYLPLVLRKSVWSPPPEQAPGR
jgi:uncharacterized repeat protein (TIGR01451 family)